MATFRQDVDYYAILGVLPTAEDVVIRAVYRALAQRYHPDKFRGPPEEADRKMREINEAFEVLSDPARRAKYDQTRTNSAEYSSYFSDYGDDPPEYDPLARDWALAVEFYPDLSSVERNLNRISWRLANAFKAHLLERKLFEQRAEIAHSMEQQFLQTYFGSDPSIIEFARRLIASGNKPAARALNDAVRVLGRGVHPSRIIERITGQFNLYEPPPPPPPPLTPEQIKQQQEEDKKTLALVVIWTGIFLCVILSTIVGVLLSK